MDWTVGSHNVAAYLDVVTWIHVYCVFSIVAICVARLVPASQQRFLSYGARGQTEVSLTDIDGQRKSSVVDNLLDRIALINVPHSWFTHFYIWSLLSSLFWLCQALSHGSVLQLVHDCVSSERAQVPAPASVACIFLMTVQSARRLWESHKFSRSSRSQMWIGHYVFGLTFYSTVNVAVWIKSVGSLLGADLDQLRWSEFWRRPGVALGLSGFVAASFVQYLAHVHLASLQKYSVPRHWLFKKLIAPHYTAECLIYLSLSLVAAPHHHWLNGTLLWIVLLTAINLGITADDTKKWMMGKFREQKSVIEAKYCLMPGVW